MSGHFAIKPDRDSYRAGDTVAGTVEVLEAVAAKSLALALEYRDWTQDYAAIGRTVALDAPLHNGDLEAGMSFPFTVELPADAWPNHTGTFGSTSWGLHVHAVRTGPDVNVWLPIRVTS